MITTVMTMAQPLESRVDKMEQYMKLQFSHIEHRLMDIESSRPAELEDRIRHVEDLLLLMQLENEKVKQMLMMRHVPVASQQHAENLADLEERLQRLEEHLPEHALDENPLAQRLEEMEKVIVEQFESFEKRISSIEEHMTGSRGRDRYQDVQEQRVASRPEPRAEEKRENVVCQEPQEKEQEKPQAVRKSVLHEVQTILGRR